MRNINKKHIRILILTILVYNCVLTPKRQLDIGQFKNYVESKKVFIDYDQYKSFYCPPNKDSIKFSDNLKFGVLNEFSRQLKKAGYEIVDTKNSAELIVVLEQSFCYYLGEKPTSAEQTEYNLSSVQGYIAMGFLGIVPTAPENSGFFIVKVKDQKSSKEKEIFIKYNFRVLVSIFTLPFIFFEFRENRVSEIYSPFMELAVFYITRRDELID